MIRLSGGSNVFRFTYGPTGRYITVVDTRPTITILSLIRMRSRISFVAVSVPSVSRSQTFVHIGDVAVR